MLKSHGSLYPAMAAIALQLLLPIAAGAWSLESQRAIAEAARKVAPPDLDRQIEKHEASFRAGIEQAPALASHRLPVGELIDSQSDRAVELIRTHSPFALIVEQLGHVAYWVAYGNNPYHAAGRTANYEDFLAYVDSARPRFRPVFYGLIPDLEEGAAVSMLVDMAARRGHRYQPLIEGEYHRVQGPPGAAKFDDRSTAFGVTAVAYSHAVTDVGLALRRIWLEAGGTDRRLLPVRNVEGNPGP